jgi:hypothetical protein
MKLLLQRSKSGKVNSIIMLEKKLFIFKKKYNPQNAHVYAANFEYFKYENRTMSDYQKPQPVMFCDGVSTRGKFH